MVNWRDSSLFFETSPFGLDFFVSPLDFRVGRDPTLCNRLSSLLSLSSALPPTLHNSFESVMSRFSSVAYSLLPSSPTKATAFTKTEHSNNGSYDSTKHSRSSSLNAIGSSSSASSSLKRRGTRRRTALLTTVALVTGAGLLYTLRQQARTASPDVQFDHRHRIAVDFETTDVPEEWSCNPFKEPGRMLSDDSNAVSSFHFASYTETKS